VRVFSIVLSLTAALVIAVAPRPANADDGAASEDVVAEVLDILKKRGVVNEEEYMRLASKNAHYEKKESRLPKIDFWGDFRGRQETIIWSTNENGGSRGNRYRLRYRLRRNTKVEVNEWADVYFRVVSGGSNPRSTNQTLGDQADFDTDDIRLDQAYVELKAPASWVPLPDAGAKLQFGKMGNPYWGKQGRDILLWDHDINLEGVTGKLTSDPSEDTHLYWNTGYYVIDEESGSRDPYFFAFQAGVEHDCGDDFRLGGRGTVFAFGNLDPDFLRRGIDPNSSDTISNAGGNTGDPLPPSMSPYPGFDEAGLTDDPTGRNATIAELYGWLQWNGLEGWPLLWWAQLSRNFSAGNVLDASENPNAWGTGIEIGSKSEVATVGLGYWRLEANAFPSQFVDNDLFDGRTNRKGFALYGSKTIMKNTDLNLSIFRDQEIKAKLPEFAVSENDARRWKFHTDVMFRF
jgi:hypothetical protein